MQKSTGASAAVIAEQIAKGKVNGPGVLTQEEGVPAEAYVEGLRQRGIMLEVIRAREEPCPFHEPRARQWQSVPI